MATKEELEKQKQEAERRKRWLAIEEKRKTREAYEIKEISGWMYFGPFLGLLVTVIAGIMIWLLGSDEAGGLWWIVGIGLAPLMLLGFTSDVDDNWKASVAAKEELESKKDKHNSEDEDYLSSSFGSSERTLNGFKYKYDYIYTDSVISYWFYVLTKFVLGLSTIAFALITAVLLFMWLGSISIAPTTIIIILLIIIILNQNKDKNL